MKTRTKDTHGFGTVYVVVANLNVVNETAEIVEVHESEARAEESRDKHERNGVRGVVVVERKIQR